jgi:hypothetical protein
MYPCPATGIFPVLPACGAVRRHANNRETNNHCTRCSDLRIRGSAPIVPGAAPDFGESENSPFEHQNVAAMYQAIQEDCGHPFIAKHLRPVRKIQERAENLLLKRA